MRIIITGGKGMLGRTLQQELAGHDIIIADLPETDITDADNIDSFVRNSRADVAIHCAAMTAVDLCESEIEKAYKLNRDGSRNVAISCNRHGTRLIAISTDYVFTGDSNRPYRESDIADGGNTVYGKSKFAGEEEIRKYCADHIIARISWLYGAGGPSFVHTMMSLADGSRPELKVVADQHGNPTSALAVARQLKNIIARPELTGTFHLTCEGEATWYDFACEIFRLAGKNQKVTACSTGEFPRPAPRPLNSRLEKSRLKAENLPPMPHWRDAVEEFMATEFPRR